MEYDRDGDFGRVRLIAHSPSVLARRLYYCVQSAGWHFCNDRYHIERETGNDNCLLLCTIGGRGVLEYGGSIYQLQPGSVALVAPGCPHSYRTPKGGQWEFYWLHFSGSGSEKFAEYIRQKNCGGLSGAVAEACRDNIQRILDLKIQRETDFETIASELIAVMLHQLVAVIPEEMADQNEAVAKVLEFIHSSYKGHIDLEMMAKAAFISRSHLVKLFEATTGYTPYEYLLKYRISRAKELLLSSRIPVGEIALAVGFSYAGNFVSTFKRMEGITPAKYRRQYHTM